MAKEVGKYDPIDQNVDCAAAGSDCVNMVPGTVYPGGMARNTMPWLCGDSRPHTVLVAHFWNLERRKQQQEKHWCIFWAGNIVGMLDIDVLDVNIESAFNHRTGVFYPVIAKYGLTVECNSSLCCLLHS